MNHNQTKNIKYILFICCFLIPTVLFTNYVINHFYLYGSGVRDVGWFTFLMTNSLEWPISNPDLIGGSYLKVHFSLFFYVSSFLHKYVLFSLPSPVYYALFIGSMYGVISVAVFIAGLSIIKQNKALALILLSLISILTSFNGAALGLIGFPHFEIAIPAFILLFVSLYFTGRIKLSYVALFGLLLIREDAGLHLFGLISIIILSQIIHNKSIKKIDFRLLTIGIIALLVGVTMIYIQKVYFNSGYTLKAVFLGSPAFAHVNSEFINLRMDFIVNNRLYLYVPIISTLIFSIFYRNIFLLSAMVSIIPWSLLLFFAISIMPNSFSNYYAFPFILMLSWPLMASIIYQNVQVHNEHKSLKKPMVLFMFITLLSTILYASNAKLNVDESPWNKMHFKGYELIDSTHRFSSYIEQHKSTYGNILFDEASSAQNVHHINKSNFGFLNQFKEKQKRAAETLILNKHAFKNPKLLELIYEKNISYIYQVPQSSILVASKTALKNNELLEPVTYWDGSFLPSETGQLKGTDIVVNKDSERGFITYGPFIKLPPGRYEFDIKYSSEEKETVLLGYWDMLMEYPNILLKGKLTGTEGKVKHIIQQFEVPRNNQNMLLEVRAHHRGSGQITIKSLTIKKVKK